MGLTIQRAKLDDLARFAELHVESMDIDPAYPVIAWIERELELDDDNALAHTLLYVAYYNLSSAVYIWLHWDELQRDRATWDRNRVAAGTLTMPTGVERRGLRGGKNMAHHLQAMDDCVDLYGSWGEWLGAAGDTWEGVSTMVRHIHGNGRWAAYKTCELLQEVHGWPISAPDMGNDGSTGPVQGLEVIAGRPLVTVREQDFIAEVIKQELDEGYGLKLPWSQLETVLCDFHSMERGHYYVGHDIDQMLEQVNKPEVDPEVRQLILRARSATLPHGYLGELPGNGWTGVDKARRLAYSSGGAVLPR
jgi:hypothetical protein